MLNKRRARTRGLFVSYSIPSRKARIMDDRMYASIPIGALDRPIAFHPILRDVGGSVTAAVFLSQALYWTKRLPEDRQGWFYKSREEWEEETSLTRYEQETARKLLKQRGLLSEEQRGIDRTIWFRLEVDVLAEAIRLEFNNRARKDSTDATGEIPPMERGERHTSKRGSIASPHITETTNREHADMSMAANGDSQNTPQFSGRHRKPITPRWVPSPETERWANAEGWTTDELSHEVERFRDHYLSTAFASAEWDATFKNWLRNPHTLARRGGGVAVTGTTTRPKPAYYKANGGLTPEGMAAKARGEI